MPNDKSLMSYLDILICDQTALKKNDCCGIISGSTGALLCCVQNYLLTRDERYKSAVYNLTDKMISQPVGLFSLGYGLAGLAWIMSLLKKIDLFENIDNWLIDFENVLENCFYVMLSKKDLDYFRGASGVLFYFIERGLQNKRLVKFFLDCLNERENGLSPSYYIDRDKNNINLGTPHGITGLILILLKLKEKGQNMFDLLIHELLEQLLSYRKLNDSYYFPGTVSGKEEKQSVLAWCYGDLMASYAILKAGLLLDNKKYVDLVNPMLSELAYREDCPHNLSLCHGYTSTSLVFRKMFDLTDNKMLYSASIKWQRLAINTFHNNIGLYKKKQLYADYFENESLFYGFPSVILCFGGIFRKDCENSLLL